VEGLRGQGRKRDRRWCMGYGVLEIGEGMVDMRYGRVKIGDIGLPNFCSLNKK